MNSEGPGERGNGPGPVPDGSPPDGTSSEVEQRPTPTGPPSKRALTLVVVPLVIMVIASNVANYTGLGFISERPLLVIALSSQIKWLVLAVNQLNPAVFFTVGMLRNLAPDPFFYILGFWYGDAAVKWMESRTPRMGELLRLVEQSFGKWGRPLVLLFPNNPICLLAGAARMRVVEFAILNIIGTAGRLVLIKVLGEAFQRPIDWLLGLLSDYRIPLLVLGFVAFGFTAWNESRKGTSEVQQLVNLDEEFDPSHPEAFHTDHHPDGDPTDQ